jgi:outer membrane protein OmpA-like peptidoglycan-associated protein
MQKAIKSAASPPLRDRVIPGPKIAEARRLRAAGPAAADGRFMLIGLFGALVVMLVLLLGSHKASPLGFVRKLETNAQKALDTAGLTAIRVRMDGQTAYVDGASPAADAEERAIKLVRASTGPGGWLRGGVSHVVANVTDAPVVAPFDWKASRRGGLVTLSGHVPSERAQREVLARANSLFDEVRDETVIASGAPPGDWTMAAKEALGGLAALPEGDARLVDHTLVLMGEGEASSIARVKRRFDTRDWGPYKLVFDVNAPGEGALEKAGISLATADQQSCQEAFTKIMARNVINFGTGSDVISDASKPLLDNLAAVARRCDGFSIEVAGHTDDVGGREVNMILSHKRAEAVVKYLAEAGVVSRRMSAVGYGPDKPVAPNDTAAGQARNRRIEFAVQL